MSGKMPSDWNAKEAYLWLGQHCSNMENHVLFTFSNGVEQGDERAFLQENNVPYLVKPFEVAELILQARRLLQKAQPAVAGAEAGFSSRSDGRGTWTALLEGLEDAAAGGIGNGVKRVIQGRGRGSHEIRNNS